MPQNPSDDKSTLVQVLAWCRQATSHYLIQCWPIFMSPYGVTRPQWVNSWAPGDIKWILTDWGRGKWTPFGRQHFQVHFLEWKCLCIKISLKFVPKRQINNIPALVQIMAWHRPDDKPLSELMMVSLPKLICVTRPQWVNQHQFRKWLVASQHQAEPMLSGHQQYMVTFSNGQFHRSFSRQHLQKCVWNYKSYITVPDTNGLIRNPNSPSIQITIKALVKVAPNLKT